LPERLDDWLLTGGYPRIHQVDIEPTDYLRRNAGDECVHGKKGAMQ
jgi:hypothetical protein